MSWGRTPIEPEIWLDLEAKEKENLEGGEGQERGPGDNQKGE